MINIVKRKRVDTPENRNVNPTFNLNFKLYIREYLRVCLIYMEIEILRVFDWYVKKCTKHLL